MPTINRTKLRELLLKLDHSTFVGFTALTTVKVPAGAPVIKKLSRVNVCVGDYQRAVTRQRAREGVEEPYVAKPRKWGTRLSLALVQHMKDGALKHYLSGQVLKAKPAIYLLEHPPLRAGRRPRLIGVDKAEIAKWLPADRTVETAEAQGVEKAVVHRDWDLANLSSVSLEGKVYHLQD